MRAATLILRGAVILLLVGSLLWPALYNGQPFFFPDTTAYVRGADAGIQKVTHHSTPWSLAPDGATETEPAATPSSLSSVKDKTVLAGRSPYYGSLLYVGEITGGFWVSIVLQAIALLVAIALALRAAAIAVWPAVPIVGLLLAAGTSLSFYVSFLMPDVFAGVTILAAATLLSVRDPLPTLDRAAWFALLTAALVFHDSHLLITASMLVLGVLWNLRHGWANYRGLVLMTAALICAAAAQMAFSFAVERWVGAPPLHPPFLMARMVADGPGYRYLKATCPGNGFKVCQFLAHMPIDADGFLFAAGTPPGVFAEATPQVRRQLAAEQPRFVLAVLRYDPGGEALASLRNFGRQITMTGLTEFDLDNLTKQFFERKIPGEHLDVLRRTAVYQNAMPLRLCSTIYLSTLLIACGFLAFAAIRPAAIGGVSARIGAIAAWIVVGFVLNAAICGVLSGPHDRYSMRVAWLLPLAALIIAAGLLSRRSPMRHPAAVTAPGFSSS
jgi:hypothetical protein